MEGSSSMGDEDRISGLPDPILHHILSFIDMKEVVHTSLLSSRWRYKWISVPCLNFDHHFWNKLNTKKQNQETVYKKDGFMDFVDKVLFLRDNSNIHKFNLSSDKYCNADRIATWITVVVRRQVQELHLDISTQQTLLLPQFLFTSDIRVFRLQSYKLRTPIRFPNSICSASHLKTLELVWVQLPEGNPNGELLLSCPNLENLYMKNCHHGNLKLLNISALQLQKLVLETCSYYSCEIKICSPNLTSLQLTGAMGDLFSVDNLSCLITVETLILSGWWLQKLGLMSERLSVLFHNLRYLKLTELSDSSFIRVILKLLERSPYIETLVLELKKTTHDTEDKGEDWGAQLSFHCMFNHLKFVEIQNLEGCKNELKFLEFLLKKAVALENIIITTIKTLSSDKEKELAKFSRTLQRLPRASSSVLILFLLKSGS